MRTVTELSALQTDCIQLLKLRSCAPLGCLIFLPSDFDATTPLLIAVHGIKREVETLMDGLMDVAQKTRHCLLLPIFTREHFPAYQRMIDSPEQIRPDWLLNRVILEFDRHFSRHNTQLKLFGFSGGAQFSHRYAYLNAARINSAILASAGWYTLPDKAIRYPYGLRRFPNWLGQVNIRKLLDINFRTWIGAEDRSRDASVRSGPRINQLQGETRYDRAHTWCRALNAARERYLLEAEQAEPLVIPGMGHDLGSFLQHSMVQQALERALSNEETLDEH